MNKFEKSILFFSLFTITLMIGRQINFSKLNLNIVDSILLIICYGISLYSTLGIAIYNMYRLIKENIHKK